MDLDGASDKPGLSTRRRRRITSYRRRSVAGPCARSRITSTRSARAAKVWFFDGGFESVVPSVQSRFPAVICVRVFIKGRPMWTLHAVIVELVKVEIQQIVLNGEDCGVQYGFADPAEERIIGPEATAVKSRGGISIGIKVHGVLVSRSISRVFQWRINTSGRSLPDQLCHGSWSARLYTSESRSRSPTLLPQSQTVSLSRGGKGSHFGGHCFSASSFNC